MHTHVRHACVCVRVCVCACVCMCVSVGVCRERYNQIVTAKFAIPGTYELLHEKEHWTSIPILYRITLKTCLIWVLTYSC